MGALDDPEIRSLCRRVTVSTAAPAVGHAGAATIVTVALKGGRHFTATVEDGTLAAADLGDKFLRLTRGALGQERAAALFERLGQLENEPDLDWLDGKI